MHHHVLKYSYHWLTYHRKNIYFKGHKDLRRILNNYGFNGYPLRKDFALTGYVGVRYDDCDKYILSEPIELSQSHLELIHIKTPWR